MVVVEVRQGTLGVDGRGWGPAGNTVDRGPQLSKDDKDDKEDEEEEDEAGGGGGGGGAGGAGGGGGRGGNWHKI